MRRAEAVERLQRFEPVLRNMGAEALFLFGSTSRDEASQHSDVDVLLDIDRAASFTLFDLAAARRLLSEGLATSVDVTTLADLSPERGRDILAKALKIF